jgi:tetratricopeptide (TPR) repeat protein
LLARWNEQISRHSRLAGGVLFLVTVVVFQKTLAGLFVFDDTALILTNPYITNPSYWQRLFLGSIWSFRGAAEQSHFYRPLQFWVYWLLYRVAGPRPAFFHLFHLLLCASTVWLVFRLGQKLLHHDLAAFAGALLWALHPLHVETVAWISALSDAGSACLVIVSFLLFLRAESKEAHPMARHIWAALVFFPALFFKEVALGFPLLVIAYWVFLGKQESWSRRAVKGSPYALAIAAYVAVRITALGRFFAAPQPWKISPRLLGAAVGVLGQHAKLLLWPVSLSLARTFDLSASLRSPWPWLTLAALLAAFVLRKREPLLTFLLAWWVITLVPCLDVRQLAGVPVEDRFSYLPSLGPCLAAAFAALVLLPERLARLNPARILVPVLLTVLALWTVQDVRSVPHWSDDAALWSHAAAASPDSALAHLFQGILLEHQKGDLDGAAREYETALRLNQSSFRPTAGMIYECDLGLGRIALSRGRTEVAVAYFEKAVHVAPVLSPAYRLLGVVYFPQGNYARAAEYFARVVKINPQDVEARFFLGTCWLKLGKPAQAAEQFHAAREVAPDYLQAYDAEARALEAAGDTAGAASVRGLKPPK